MADAQNLRKGIDCIGVGIIYFCHDGKGNLLFMKRSQNARDEQGTWDVGGGALEIHETIEETLRREIREEYMTDVINYEFLGYRDVHRVLPNGQKTHWVALDFVVQIDRDKVKIGEPHKIDAIGWYTLENHPEPLHSQLPLGIEMNKEKLMKVLGIQRAES